MTPLVSTFDPDARAPDARIARAAFALYRNFIRDDARAEFPWSKLKDEARARWMVEARIVAAALGEFSRAA